MANTRESLPWSYIGADKFKHFVDGANAKRYDVAANSPARTSERAKVLDFTVPYTVQDFGLWVHERNTGIKNAAALKGKTAGVSTGTTNDV